MRVCHVITGLGIGGAEMMLLKLVGEFRARSFSQCVVSLMDKGVLGQQLERLSIPVHCLNMKQGRPSWRALRRLNGIIKDYRPDVIQGWMYHANLIASLVAGRRDPVVWGVRQSLYELEKVKWATRLVISSGRFFARHCDRIVYNSVTGARQHQELGYPDSKGVVIGNGFDLERFRPDAEARTRVRRELGLRDCEIVLGNVARYDPMKNHVGLIQAFSDFAARIPNVHLVMAGSGIDPSNTVLANEIKATAVHRQIHLVGLRTDVERLMNGFDLYVSSSAGEGFPNVIGEAMACGVPCVATDVGDSRWIVGETGWIVEPGDLPGLAHAMQIAIGLPARIRAELGALARARIQERYSMRSIGDEYEMLYRDVSKKRMRERMNANAA